MDDNYEYDPANDRLLTWEEVAAILALHDRKVPKEAVRHLRRTGRIRGILVGGRWRYPWSSVRDYLAGCPQARPDR